MVCYEYVQMLVFALSNVNYKPQYWFFRFYDVHIFHQFLIIFFDSYLTLEIAGITPPNVKFALVTLLQNVKLIFIYALTNANSTLSNFKFRLCKKVIYEAYKL